MVTTRGRGAIITVLLEQVVGKGGGMPMMNVQSEELTPFKGKGFWQMLAGALVSGLLGGKQAVGGYFGGLAGGMQQAQERSYQQQRDQWMRQMQMAQLREQRQYHAGQLENQRITQQRLADESESDRLWKMFSASLPPKTPGSPMYEVTPGSEGRPQLQFLEGQTWPVSPSEAFNYVPSMPVNVDGSQVPVPPNVAYDIISQRAMLPMDVERAGLTSAAQTTGPLKALTGMAQPPAGQTWGDVKAQQTAKEAGAVSTSRALAELLPQEALSGMSPNEARQAHRTAAAIQQYKRLVPYRKQVAAAGMSPIAAALGGMNLQMKGMQMNITIQARKYSEESVNSIIAMPDGDTKYMFAKSILDDGNLDKDLDAQLRASLGEKYARWEAEQRSKKGAIDPIDEEIDAILGG